MNSPSGRYRGDRRAHARLQVDLPATLWGTGSQAARGRILDYCAGGLYVAIDGAEGDLILLDGQPIQPAQPLAVRFELEEHGTVNTHDVSVAVARVFAGGVGVAFVHAEADSIAALERAARRSTVEQSNAREMARARARAEARPVEVAQSAALSVVSGAKSLDLLNGVRELLDEFIERIHPGMFEYAEELLFSAAREATSNSVQSECFDAIKELKSLRISVLTGFRQAMLVKLDKLAPGAERAELPPGADTTDTSSLTLLDTSTFDDWLHVKNVATRMQPLLAEGEYALARRLDEISGISVDEDGCPLGVREVCYTFNDSMQTVGMGSRPRKAVYRGFEGELVKHLEGFQASVNDYLARAGVLPVVSRPSAVVNKANPG
ncbi:MAG: DUF1631 family protein, partial [Gammaproteobacteria bacterium]|nr:DUF1631 family protein [Gammaproteobacteria bacterium]